jgi:K+-sensing histidine kinase KdpD
MIVFEVAGNFGTETSPTLHPTQYFVGNVALMLAAFCPLALLYAVFRHRLLDISFVVNRALVYSAMTGLILLVVGFVDWIAGKYLFETHAALAVEAGITIGLGFVLQRIHGVLERAVDRVIFARRHAAEQHIERVIAGLAFARTHGAILRAVVEDPRLALELISCAIFIDDGNALTLQCNNGWKPGETPKIERDDSLARLLLSERRVIGIAEAHWNADIAKHAPGSLDIAVPLFARNDLLGIALYGRHRNGTAIDPEERRLLYRLCEAAAVAFEAVALAEAKEELAAMRSPARLDLT